jgi:hypothetical protein
LSAFPLTAWNFYFQNYLSSFLVWANGRGTNCGLKSGDFTFTFASRSDDFWAIFSKKNPLQKLHWVFFFLGHQSRFQWSYPSTLLHGFFNRVRVLVS